jgi:hypothetical protein
MVGTYEREEKYVFFFFGGKPEGKRPLRKLMRRFEDNIMIGFK